MIGAQAGIIWSYDDPSKVTNFDETHPLLVSSTICNNSSFCRWYLSPVWSFSDPKNTQYALLGEWNKWTAVSRQRFNLVTTNAENTKTLIQLVGGVSEKVEVLVYH